jgi:pilus assembly protein Flp/PilA
MILNRLGRYATISVFSLTQLALLRDRRAVTAVEYALIAGIIVLAIVGGVTAVGKHLTGGFNTVASEL